MTRNGDIIDPAHTVRDLVEQGHPVEQAVTVRAFGRWLELNGPRLPRPGIAGDTDGVQAAPAGRAREVADELGVHLVELEAALGAFAASHPGSARELLELLGEPIPCMRAGCPEDATRGYLLCASCAAAHGDT